jgi:hypothetical protein
MGESERLAAIRRLDDQARSVQGAHAMTEEELEQRVAAEWSAKERLGGRTVVDDAAERARAARSKARARQLSLRF